MKYNTKREKNLWSERSKIWRKKQQQHQQLRREWFLLEVHMVKCIYVTRYEYELWTSILRCILLTIDVPTKFIHYIEVCVYVHSNFIIIFSAFDVVVEQLLNNFSVLYKFVSFQHSFEIWICCLCLFLHGDLLALDIWTYKTGIFIWWYFFFFFDKTTPSQWVTTRHWHHLLGYFFQFVVIV